IGPPLFVCVPNVVSHYVSSPRKRGPSKRWASRPRRPVIASNSATSRILVPRFRGDDRWSKGFRTMADTNKPLTNDNAFRGPLTGGSMEPTFGGALSFMRRRYTRDLTGVDAVVWGIPFDQATSNRPGARFGPQAIRRASAIFDGDPQYPFGFDPFETLAVVDYGDAAFDYSRPMEFAAAIEKQAATIIAGGADLFTLGGDHFITYPLLKAHHARYGQLGLVQFDAHQDTWPAAAEHISHGSFVKRAVDEGLIDPARSIQIGIRTVAPEDCGIAIIGAEEVDRIGIAGVIERVRERV